jgi:hypothetical protein
MTTVNKKHPTMKERFEIYEVMRQIITKHDDGTCEYRRDDNGFSVGNDRSLSERFGFPMHVIQNMRVQGFGNLRRAAPPEAPAGITERLITERLDALSAHLVEVAREKNAGFEERLRALEISMRSFEKRFPRQRRHESQG